MESPKLTVTASGVKLSGDKFEELKSFLRHLSIDLKFENITLQGFDVKYSWKAGKFHNNTFT